MLGFSSWGIGCQPCAINDSHNISWASNTILRVFLIIMYLTYFVISKITCNLSCKSGTCSITLE